MCNGTIIRNAYNEGGFGNYIIMKDSSSNMGFLYAHMSEKSPLQVGDNISIGQYVGHEGTTGNSSGIHLHLEMQDLTNHDWIFQAPKEIYSNPAEFMGIPNVKGISCYYNGTPINPPNPPSPEKHYNKWWNIYIKNFNITT